MGVELLTERYKDQIAGVQGTAPRRHMEQPSDFSSASERFGFDRRICGAIRASSTHRHELSEFSRGPGDGTLTQELAIVRYVHISVAIPDGIRCGPFRAMIIGSPVSESRQPTSRFHLALTRVRSCGW